MKKFTLILALVLANINPASWAASARNDYVAHEWGTFTSVQGADGVQFAWNPFDKWDLPEFVYDRNRPQGDPRRPRFAQIASKSAFQALQRMETPVIYFYSKNPRSVDVQVEFPQGLITEWYPQVSKFGPAAPGPQSNPPALEFSQKSLLAWSNVQIRPQSDLTDGDGLLPSDGSKNAYYAARQTDSACLQIDLPSEPGKPTSAQFEKFLFYRGIGQFQAPLRVVLSGNERHLQLSNTGKDPLRHLFALEVRQGQGRFFALGDLAPGGNRTLRIKPESRAFPLSDFQEQLGEKVAAALVEEGLFAKEATAMVATWRDSWFGEDGLRVLYVLPRAWTDATLPLTLAPAPDELVRVMVGRAELITPTMEWQLLKQIVRFSEAAPETQDQAVAAVRALGLGRFAEPTARRVLGPIPSQEFSQSTWNLLDRIRQSAIASKSLVHSGSAGR